MRGKRIPSYRLHKPTGQAVVTLGGRDIYLGKHGTDASRESYERAVIEWQAYGRVGRAPKAAPLSVASLVAKFWQHVDAQGLYTKNGKPTSERSCLVVALRPLVRLYGTTPAGEFGPKALRNVRLALCQPAPERRDGSKRRRVHTGPRARQSVNGHVHRIRSVFRWAVGEELLDGEQWQRLRSVEALKFGAPGVVEGRGVKPANLRDVAKVLRRVDSRTATLIRLQYLTAARPGEVVQMRMGDLDRNLDVWLYRPGSHKSEHHGGERVIAIGPRAQKLLAPFFKADPAAWLFPGRQGHITESAYAKAVRDAVRALGLPRWTPHQLRHNALTNVRRTEGLDGAQVVGGHHNMSTTETYAEKDYQKAIRYAQAHG